MSDPLQALLAAGAVDISSFPANSRYRGVALAQTTRADGTPLRYLRRRLVPDPVRFATLRLYAVRQNDRPDAIAAGFFGDPELWWRLADANGVIDPAELTAQIGRQLRITAQEDLPGPASGI